MRFLHFTNTLNVGDESCCPQRYFIDIFGEMPVDHIKSAKSGEIAVIGGGGIIHPDFIGCIERLGPSIVWGAGSNYHGRTELIYPGCLDEWPLVGIRDVGSKYRWVPCASCMSRCFDCVPKPDLHAQRSSDRRTDRPCHDEPWRPGNIMQIHRLHGQGQTDSHQLIPRRVLGIVARSRS